MALFSNVAAAEVPVEVLDGAPRWSYGNLAEKFARVQILVTWYGGDPDRYLAAIAAGMEDRGDEEFVLEVKRRLLADPSLGAYMRRVVAEFASRFGCE
ncbi:MAG TPA: hypothetical protein VHK90_15570 [Thermoanaerobaculia bacterium]|nr:hypothetical protein [Thermoanaerobaculia bacterium]